MTADEVELVKDKLALETTTIGGLLDPIITDESEMEDEESAKDNDVDVDQLMEVCNEPNNEQHEAGAGSSKLLESVPRLLAGNTLAAEFIIDDEFGKAKVHKAPKPDKTISKLHTSGTDHHHENALLRAVDTSKGYIF